MRSRPAMRTPTKTFSALGRAVWDETKCCGLSFTLRAQLSVLSVEPYGMKPFISTVAPTSNPTFSALGRAVWDETLPAFSLACRPPAFSALGRAVWDETAYNGSITPASTVTFSALGRAVWDETQCVAVPYPTAPAFQCSRSSRMG